MATYTLPGFSPACPVHIPGHVDLDLDGLLAFPAYKTWAATLQHSLALQAASPEHPFHASPYSLRKVTVQSVDRFGGGRLGFVKFVADVANAAGEKLPGSTFLRGGAVGMLIVLQPDDVPAGTETDKHVLMTLQPRIPAGTLAMAEIPAGMLDDAGSFAGAAAKEIEEEVGLTIPESALLDMTALALAAPPGAAAAAAAEGAEKLQRAVYTSGGGSDEFIALLLHQRRVPRAQLAEWTGKLTGLRDRGEKITLKCVRLDALWREGAHDCKALSALALYEGLRREGRL